MSDLDEMTKAITKLTEEITRLIQSQERLTQALLDSEADDKDESFGSGRYLS